MKKKTVSILSIIICMIFCFIAFPTREVAHATSIKPMLAIIIDDFGGYDQSGVETMLSIDAPLTCAIMPNLENTYENATKAKESGKEVIVHMPMQAHVSLPLNWYGTNYIGNYDSKEQVYNKLSEAFKSVPNAQGFNIHIGSGVCQHKEVMNSIYDYANTHNLFFVDSRTHINTICEEVATSKNTLYLGRDEFLEPNGNKSYAGVKQHLMVGANVAKEKGYAIVIGHVGSHGGEQTARAIKDSIEEIKNMGIEIVPISKLNKELNSTFVNKKKNESEITK